MPVNTIEDERPTVTYRGESRPNYAPLLAGYDILTEEALGKVKGEAPAERHFGKWVLVLEGEGRNRIYQMSTQHVGRTFGPGAAVTSVALLNGAVSTGNEWAIPLHTVQGRQVSNQVVKCVQSRLSSSLMDYEAVTDASGSGATRGTADWWVIANPPVDLGVNPTAPVEDAPVVDWEAMHDALQTKYDALWEALNEEANDRDWCSEYDKFAAKNGGPVRQRRYEIVARLSREVSYSDLSSELAGVLSTQGESISVHDSVTIEYDVTQEISCSAEEIENETPAFNDTIAELLNERGFVYDDFEIASYDEA